MLEILLAMIGSQKVEQSSHILSRERFKHLPEPMQRYMTQSGVVGKEIARTIHLKQEGLFNLTGKKWIPIKAEQTFNTERNEFIWKARTGVMFVVDQFINNRGSLTVRLFDLIKVEEASGPEVDQGEALRYLTECIWFPSGFASDRIIWESIDDHSARGSIQYCDKTASAVFHLNDKGEIIEITARRYAKEDNGMVLQDWVIHDLKYKVFAGIRIPFKASVGWNKDGLIQDYYRFEITEIAYNAT
ncbi:MAG: hypothetical protein KJO04_01450 [Bacteroidia bacterium]|nr:hypothetical protein [Bacteroidia bacterium]